MVYLWKTLFHGLLTSSCIAMRVCGIIYDITELWAWGIVVLVAGNVIVYFLLFIIALLMIPAARHQDSATGMNQHNIRDRVRYCKKCGKEVEYTIMICPNCGNNTYTENKPVGIVEEKSNNDEKVDE